MSNIKDDKYDSPRPRPLFDDQSERTPLSHEESLDRELQLLASFVEYISHCRPEVLLNWMRAHPDSDFIQWLRTFEDAGL